MSDINTSGRPSITESQETQERYIKIWTLYNVSSKTQFAIAQEMGIATSTISNALKWVKENLLKVPSETLLSGAIFAIRERMERIKKLYDEERKKKEPSVRSVVELNRELRNDQEFLLKLQEVYHEKYEIEASLDTAEILRIITAKKK